MDAMQYLDLNQSVKWQMSVGGLAQSVECVVSNDEAPGSKPGFSTLFWTVKTFCSKKAKTPPAGFEPATPGLEVRCAIQLRHGGKPTLVGLEPTTA